MNDGRLWSHHSPSQPLFEMLRNVPSRKLSRGELRNISYSGSEGDYGNESDYQTETVTKWKFDSLITSLIILTKVRRRNDYWNNLSIN